MAPEILRELPYNEKCDVFSYAVVLWELYTRNIPWHKVGAFRVANDVAYQGQRHVLARLAWPGLLASPPRCSLCAVRVVRVGLCVEQIAAAGRLSTKTGRADRVLLGRQP